MKRILILMTVLLTALLPALTRAGSSEGAKGMLPDVQVAAFSDRVQRDLAARGAHVAIVARMGRDPKEMPQGITYTHVGYWVYSQITRADGSVGHGYRVYNLYQNSDDGTRSTLVQDSPADFFAGAYRLDAGVIIPDVRLQKKLLKTITSPTYGALHNASYSVLANPKTTRFQNCTEHTLDILMASLYDTSDLRRIKANINAHFQPQHVEVNGFKRMIAPAASRALTTADHGTRIGTATFGSIARFMQTHGLEQDVYRFTPDGVRGF
jgi:hypothetical protein